MVIIMGNDNVFISIYKWIGFLLPFIYSTLNDEPVITIWNFFIGLVLSVLWLPYIIAYWLVTGGLY